MQTFKLNYVLVFLFLFSITTHVAQEKEITYIYKDLQNNKSYALFGDKVKLRAAPNTTAEVLAILRIGDPITIVQKTDQVLETTSAKTAWYEVIFNNKKGFIAGQFIANAHKTVGKNTFYFHRLQDTTMGKLQIRVTADHQNYTKTAIQIWDPNIGVTFNSFQGLENIQQILEVHYFGDSCGAENGFTVLFLKDDNKLVKIAHLSSIGDGGVYSLSEKFTYTHDEMNGKPIIIFTKEEEELIDEEKRWYETQSLRRIFEWNGEALVPEFSKKFKKSATSH